MAILSYCLKCNSPFNHSASDGRSLCRDCDGTKERERAEAERWANLSVEAKLDELKARVDIISNQSPWDGRIG